MAYTNTLVEGVSLYSKISWSMCVDIPSLIILDTHAYYSNQGFVYIQKNFLLYYRNCFILPTVKSSELLLLNTISKFLFCYSIFLHLYTSEINIPDESRRAWKMDLHIFSFPPPLHASNERRQIGRPFVRSIHGC